MSDPEYLGYIAMSADGFIADREGGVGWLEQFGVEGEDNGYGEFIAHVDALVSGRATYEQVMGWGWPYEERPAYVLTHEEGYTGEHVAAAGDMPKLDAAIREAGHRKVWVLGGGQAQRAALDAGMFDHLKLFIMPIILGGGIPLFSPGVSRRLTFVSITPRPAVILKIEYKIYEYTWPRPFPLKAT